MQSSESFGSEIGCEAPAYLRHGVGFPLSRRASVGCVPPFTSFVTDERLTSITQVHVNAVFHKRAAGLRAAHLHPTRSYYSKIIASDKLD